MATTYGKVTHEGGYWLITCEPHVRARIKRVFARMQKAATDTVQISDTPENSRDLAWFLERYPMMVEWDVKALLGAQAAKHVAMEQSIADLLSKRRPPTNVKLAVPARQYQLEAAEMVAIRGGLLLADDVGLGKSIAAIAAMLHAGRLPAVVVCDTHLPQQWAGYLHRFAPDLRVHVVRSGKPYSLIKGPRQRVTDLWADRLPDVIIVNYHKLRGWAETLKPLTRFVVFDECQALRHTDTMIHRAAEHLAAGASARMGLSATPIYNYGAEFYNVVDVLMRGCLGTRDEFLREWCTADPGEKSRLKDSREFGAYLRREGIMLRRTREDVGRELPELTKVGYEIEADQEALARIKGNAVALARVILANNERYRGEKMHAAGEFDMLMRQATGVAKAPYVADFVRMLVESGESVVLFGWHRDVYSIWQERLAEFNPVLYTGTESPSQKDAAKAAFVNGDSKVLIVSLRSGAGLDGLQTASSTVVIGELDWSPGVLEQCIGRVHRDGQTKPVMVYYLLSTEGSDPIVADVLGIKREQIEGVRNPSIGMAERVDNGENQIRRLAAGYLLAHGEPVPEDGSTVVRPLRPQPQGAVEG
ncbi:MAG TPA: DEAD/DEAH box helicase [Nevskiaceae bacterium]|nr:DEAD/DEAH box helicase [Nevskiaceae bacterium]